MRHSVARLLSSRSLGKSRRPAFRKLLQLLPRRYFESLEVRDLLAIACSPLDLNLDTVALESDYSEVGSHSIAAADQETGMPDGAFTMAASSLSAPILSSRSAATAKLILDFDGDIWNTAWGDYGNIPGATPAFDRDGDPTTFSNAELNDIREIWARVAEHFSPFDIDVTTLPYGLSDNFTQKIVIGGNGAWYPKPTTTGVALLGSFYNNNPNVGFVFSNKLLTNQGVAQTISHEAGHAFGLQHQSMLINGKWEEYSPGNGLIAPIMGNNPWLRNVWYEGPSFNEDTGAIHSQSDLSILSNSQNGFGYRPDDHGGSHLTSTPLVGWGNSYYTANGVIETNTDVDYFSFTAAAGRIHINVSPAPWGPMLDATIGLVDGSGAVIWIAATPSLGESLIFDVPGGTYYAFVRGAGQYGDLGQYTLTINTTPPGSPTGAFLWSTYMGGSATDGATDVATDLAGNVYVAGHTNSPGWVSGGRDTTHNGAGDAFVAKLDPSGAHLWSTYLGGSSDDVAYAVATDAAGNVYVAGRTQNAGWVSGGFDTTYNGGFDAFVMKLNPSGAHLWSTYLGGDSIDEAFSLAIDAEGNVYVAGRTASAGWISGGFDTTHSVTWDAFVVKLSATGAHLWSTYLGGASVDQASALATDSAGNVYVAGSIESGSASAGWVSGGFDTTHNGEYDAFVAKLSPSGGHLWSTYLGGNEDDGAGDLATDAAGNVYVAGGTSSAGWVSGGYDTTYSGDPDAYVVKLSSTGSHLWSTYLGGIIFDTGRFTYADGAGAIKIDAVGNVYVAGSTGTTGWVSGGFDTTYNGLGDAFVARLDSTGAHVWSSYLGGSSNDGASSLAIDAVGNVYIGGSTQSSGSINNNIDAFVAKVSASGPSLTRIDDRTVDAGTPLNFSVAAVTPDPNATLIFGLDPGAPAGAAIDPTTGNFTWVPTIPGEYAITVRVIDSSSWPPKSATETFQVTVNEVPPPPDGRPWSTYLGGSETDWGNAVATDAAGNVYIAGKTSSAGWVSGGIDTSINGGDDVFVVKLSSAGALLWSTYLGGNGADWANALAIDAAGNVYVGGGTNSSGWVSGGFDTTFNVGDAFVVKLSASGAHLWSTYLGGISVDEANALATDPAGNVYVTGETYSSGWVSGGFDTAFNGSFDGFVVKLSPSGAHLWSTYLGGGGFAWANALATDASGNVYVAGNTTGSTGWVSGGFDETFNGGLDGFVVKLSPSGVHLWSTYLGGIGFDETNALAIDPTGNVYVAGNTDSTGWVSGGFDTTTNGGLDGFVMKLSPSGAHLWSTYLGGSVADWANALTTDLTGNVYVAGETESTGWVSGGSDTTFNGGSDGFVVKLSSSGAHLWSTHLGGSGLDWANALATDSVGNVYVAGGTDSSGWVSDGFDTIHEGDSEAFVAKLNGTRVALVPFGDWTVGEGSPLTLNATLLDPDPNRNFSFRLAPGAPTGAAIDSTTGLFTWIPSEAQGPGVYSITVLVTDDSDVPRQDGLTFTVTVNEVNSLPVLGAIGNKSGTVGTQLSFTATASDADLPANTQTYSLGLGAPLGATINASTGAFTWTPLSQGGFQVTVIVTDDFGGSDSETFTITASAAGVTLPFSDNFNRANGTSLGASWTETLGNLGITNQRVVLFQNTESTAVLASLSAADVSISGDVDLSTAEVGRSIALMVRAQGPGDANAYWGVYYRSDSGYAAQIYKNIGGVPTALRSVNVPGPSGTMRFEVFGTTLNLYFNGTLVTSVIDDSLTGSGAVGIRQTGGALDNFAAAIAVPPLSESAVLPFTDNFTRADNGIFGTKWTERSGDAGIRNNMAGLYASDTSIITLNGVIEADVSVSADFDITGVPAQFSSGLLARYSGPGDANTYMARLYRSDGGVFAAQIWKSVNGHYTPLRSVVVPSGQGNLRFEVVGDQLQLFFNNNLVASTIDTSITGPGMVGMRLLGGTADNFSATELQAPSELPAELPFLDTFSRAESSSLGEFWKERVGDLGVRNQRMELFAGEQSVATLNGVAETDIEVSADVNIADGGNVGLLARYTGPGDSNAYMGLLQPASGGTFAAQIWKNTGSGWQNLTHNLVVSGAGELQFLLEGPQLQLFFEGVLVGSVIDSSITGAGTVGVRQGGGTVDNFFATSLPALEITSLLFEEELDWVLDGI